MRHRLLAVTTGAVVALAMGVQTATASPPSASQIVGQVAQSEQQAESGALAAQLQPENKNVSVRVLSEGANGDVTQSNDVSADSKAKNENEATQNATQNDPSSSSSCGCEGATGTQAIGQIAGNKQDAKSGALAIQKGASNKNIDVRVLSPGDNGNVSQANSVSADSKAKNENEAEQTATQNGGSNGPGSTGVQAIGQLAGNDQTARSGALAVQDGATNTNVPVRVLSWGDNGSVTQSNDVSAKSRAKNENEATQNATQNDPSLKGGRGCGCDGSTGVQAIGQAALSHQNAESLAIGAQLGEKNPRCGCGSDGGNSSDPVNVLSFGGGGDASQTNDASADSRARNWDMADQLAKQDQGW